MRRRDSKAPAIIRERRKLQPRRPILIVCEGQKTEPNYFDGVRMELRLQTLRVEIVRARGTDPRSVVQHAIDRKADLREQLGDDPEAWAVFDRDQHQARKLHEAWNLACVHGIRSAFSNPCFELWYLLHFVDQRASLSRQTARRELDKPKRLPGYDKSRGYFTTLAPLTETASIRARALRAKHLGDGTERIEANPRTEVDELVSYLLAIGRPAQEG